MSDNGFNLWINLCSLAEVLVQTRMLIERENTAVLRDVERYFYQQLANRIRTLMGDLITKSELS